MSDAVAFRALHEGPDVLLIANAWDAGSARLIESLGAKAIATTSAGLAWANGYPDGDALPVEALLASVRAIRRVISVPLSADIEGGYSDDAETVGALVARLHDVGVIGVNLEDGAGAPETLCAKIAAVKRAAPEVFVNARTDVYLRALVAEPDAALAETTCRMRLYADAGADGLFVPGPADAGLIGALAAAAPRPLNVMARPGVPDAAALAALGVRRLSAGSGISQLAVDTTARSARAFLIDGRLPDAGADTLSYPAINALFA